MAIRLKEYFFLDAPTADRFLRGDKPKEKTFRDLFESIAFKGNISDTAKLNMQGLVKIANATQILSRVRTDGQGFVVMPTPDLLPTVIAEDPTITVTATQDASGFMIYSLKVNPGSLGITIPTPGLWVDIGAFTVAATAGQFEEGYDTSTYLKLRTLSILGSIQISGNARRANSGGTPAVFKVPVGYEPVVDRPIGCFVGNTTGGVSTAHGLVTATGYFYVDDELTGTSSGIPVNAILSINLIYPL